MRRRLTTINVIIVIAVLAALGIVGYKYYTINQERKTSAATNVTNVPAAPKVTTSSDLDKAATTMDNATLETSNDDDLTQLEAELDNF